MKLQRAPQDFPGSRASVRLGWPVPMDLPRGYEPDLTCMMVVTTTSGEDVGHVHCDGRGWVAWDFKSTWLGRTENSRFITYRAAFNALVAAFRARTGRDPGALWWRPDW